MVAFFIFQRVSQKCFSKTVRSIDVGENLIFQKRFPEAEQLLLESYQNLKNSQGAQNPRTILAQNCLTELYEVWNKPEQTEKFRNQFAQ